jgi:hypothetical protein
MPTHSFDVKQLTGRFNGMARSYLLAGQRVRLGNLLISGASGLDLPRELLVHVKPGADPKRLAAALETAFSLDTAEPISEPDFVIRNRFARVLLVGPSNDQNLPKIPPKGVYRIAYWLLTQRDDTDVVVYDPNYWYNAAPDSLFNRPYDLVGWSSLFSSFVHDAEQMASLQGKYPGVRNALQVLGGMSATHWDPESIFKAPVSLAVKGFSGETAMGQIIDRLPVFAKDKDLSVFAPLDGTMVRGRPETFSKLPVFYDQQVFAEVIQADHRLVPFEGEQDIIGHHGYFRQKENLFLPLNEVGRYPLHLLSFQLICKARCVFCSSAAQNFKAARHLAVIQHRPKISPHVKISPRDLVAVLEEAIAAHPRLDNIRYDEDNFLSDPKAARELCRLLIDHGLQSYPWKIKARVDQIARDPQLIGELRRAGCYGADLGGESFSQKVLNDLKKDITVEELCRAIDLLIEHGFQVIQVNLMLFTPTSTMDDVLETMRQATAYAAKEGVFINLLPYVIALPGAPLMEMDEYRGLITYKDKTLPGGHTIRKPGMIRVRDARTQRVLDQTIARIGPEIAQYHASLRSRGLPFTKMPEYLYGPIFFRIVYQVLEKEGADYRQQIEELDRLIETLTVKTAERNGQ